MAPADIARARDFAYRQQYDSALAITSAAMTVEPSDPAACYWHAAIIQLLIYDSGQAGLADSFFALSDRAVAFCRLKLDQDANDAQAQLYWGMTQLNRASFLGWQQRPLSAFRVLLGVAPHLNAALKLDSSLTDARFGLGMIEYFKAVSSRYTLGLRLMGSRAKGYAAVKSVADGQGPSKPAAEVMLAYMHKEDGDYDAALTYCGRLLAAYPGNWSALRMTRDVFFKSKRYADALRVGAELDSELAGFSPESKYAQSENWLVCAKAYAQMGKKEEARERFDRVIAWEQYQDDVPWLALYVRQAKQWRKKFCE
jgi:tetratricopeptide (TPR) repeat protein